MEGSPWWIDPVARLSGEIHPFMEEDVYFAALASADGAEDEAEDADCADAVAAIDAATVELGRALSEKMLAAKTPRPQRGYLKFNFRSS